MAQASKPIQTLRYPWARGGFDLEGWVAALAMIIVGLLLGWLWSPLFLLGLIAAIAALLATRHGPRTVAEATDAVVSPVDGVLHSILEGTPPAELRFEQEKAIRLRVSSSPFTQNRILSPASGEVSTLLLEAGRQSILIAPDPDAFGLERMFLTIEGSESVVGTDVKVAAFGPRMDADVTQGDKVAKGEIVGKRRLGGWCDVWLPLETEIAVVPGQTLMAGETVLTSAGAAVAATDDEDGETDGADELEAATAAMFDRLRKEVGEQGDDADKGDEPGDEPSDKKS